MTKAKIKLRLQGVQLLYFLACTISAIIIASDTNCPHYYSALWMLPLFWGVVVALATCIYPSVMKQPVFLALLALLSVRNVVTPIFMRFGDYYGLFRDLSISNVSKAILFMLVESTFLILAASYYVQKYGRSNKKNTNLTSRECYLSTPVFYVAVVFLLTFFLLRPDFYSAYKSIFSSNEVRAALVDSASLTEAGGLFGLFNYMLPWVYLYICLYIMGRWNNKFKSEIIKTLLNLLIVIVPLFFMRNEDMFTLVCVFCLAYMSFKTKGISLRSFLFIGIIGGAFGCLYILYIITQTSGWFKGTSTGQNFSCLLQAYLPGVCNFAGYFNMGEHSRLHTLFYDIYATIPGRKSLFGLPLDDRLVIMYCQDNNAPSQIIPCFCQLYHYLFVFAPFVEILFIKHGFKQYYKAEHAKNIYERCTRIMLCVFLILTPIIYNATIFFARFLQTMLPMLIISRFVGQNEHETVMRFSRLRKERASK